MNKSIEKFGKLENKGGEFEGILIKRTKSGKAWKVSNDSGHNYEIVVNIEDALEMARRLLETPYSRPVGLLTMPEFNAEEYDHFPGYDENGVWKNENHEGERCLC